MKRFLFLFVAGTLCAQTGYLSRDGDGCLPGSGYMPRSGPVIQTLTNVQKLSLDPATSVGTQVRVSDGFYVSGHTDPNANGFYFWSQENARYVKSLPQDDDTWVVTLTDTWRIGTFNSSFTDADTIGGVNPWDVAWTGAGLTLTHPASQQLAAASTAQGGVFVAGETQDGVYADDGFTNEGKAVFSLLGHSVGSDPAYGCTWVLDLSATGGSVGAPSVPGWTIRNGEPSMLYYSTSAVDTPHLASNWKNVSDDSPASITVTNVTVGNLVSGWKVGSVIRTENGSQNGRNLYRDVLGVAVDLGWDGTKWTDGTTNGSGNTAFPDFGTADPVASKANWTQP